MEAVIILAVCVVFGATNILCFLTGAKVGQAVQKGETIETPSVNPVKAIREREEKREAQREADRLATILENIEKYDGTDAGQKDVPRR